MFAIHFIIWTSLLIIIEYWDQLFGKLRKSALPTNEYPPPPIYFYSNLTRLAVPANEDADVTEERQRVSKYNSDDLVKVVELRKEYQIYSLIIFISLMLKRYPAPDGGKKIAVKNLTFGIPRGECFGLLGMNGAGKVCYIIHSKY